MCQRARVVLWERDISFFPPPRPPQLGGGRIRYCCRSPANRRRLAINCRQSSANRCRLCSPTGALRRPRRIGCRGFLFLFGSVGPQDSPAERRRKRRPAGGGGPVLLQHLPGSGAPAGHGLELLPVGEPRSKPLSFPQPICIFIAEEQAPQVDRLNLSTCLMIPRARPHAECLYSDGVGRADPPQAHAADVCLFECNRLNGRWAVPQAQGHPAHIGCMAVVTSAPFSSACLLDSARNTLAL